jgi:hypothetical protein
MYSGSTDDGKYEATRSTNSVTYNQMDHTKNGGSTSIVPTTGGVGSNDLCLGKDCSTSTNSCTE